jgi:DNA-binding CsgD family transcriptional regulator/PAS domain-containing protein
MKNSNAGGTGSGRYSEATILALVSHLYDAALNRQLWPRFLDLLADTIDGHHVALSSLDAQSGSVVYLAASRSDPAFREEYHRHYAAEDPWVQAARARGRFQPGVVELGENILPASVYKRTAFFNDLGRRYDFHGGVAGIFGDGFASFGGISSSQRRSGEFDDAELRLFQTLLPHLQRAFELSRRLGVAEYHCESVLETLDKISAGAILVDVGGKPILANSAARRILSHADGLSSTRSGLCANTSTETHAFQKLVFDSACAATTGTAVAGGAMRLSRRSTKHPLHVRVSRLATSLARRLDEQAVAVVFVHDPEDDQQISCERLAALYCLTNAEARIGSLLALGSSVQDISRQLNVSSHTVRTHVKHLLAKTDTRNQAQLVRLIVRSLAAIGDTDPT